MCNPQREDLANMRIMRRRILQVINKIKETLGIIIEEN